MYMQGPGSNSAPRSATAMTAMAPLRPCDTRVVPSSGSTAMSVRGSLVHPMRSPQYSIGASSFSPVRMRGHMLSQLPMCLRRFGAQFATMCPCLQARTFPDHNHAIHRDTVEDLAHLVDCSLIRRILVTLAKPAPASKGCCLQHASMEPNVLLDDTGIDVIALL